MFRIRAIVFVAALPLLASCGSTTAPTPTYPAVAGTWTGTMQTASRGTVNVTLTLVQQQNILTGNWTSSTDWSGSVVGTVTAQGSFVGTLTFSAVAADGSPCSGSGSFGGAFTTSRFSASSSGFSGACGALPTDITLLTQRQ